MDVAGLIILCVIFFGAGVATALAWERSRRRRYERRIVTAFEIAYAEHTARRRSDDRLANAERHLQAAVMNERRIIDEFVRSTTREHQAA